MDWLKRFWNTLRPARMDRELRLEMETHLAEIADEQRRRGATPEEAARLARQRFGNTGVHREATRDRDLLVSVETAIQDLRYAFRQLARKPGFTMAAVLMLALGIGVNAAIFTLMNSIVLRSLPLRDAERLVVLLERNASAGDSPPSWLDQRDLREQTHSFESLAAFSYGSTGLLEIGNESRRITAGYVTPDYFSTLGVEPVIGRLFEPSEGQEGHANVVVLREDFWHTAFQGDPDILHRTIKLNGERCNVAGILPSRVKFPVEEVALWAPLVPPAKARNDRGYHGFPMIARMKPGVTFESAQADADAVMRRLAKQFPDEDTDRGGMLIPFREWNIGWARQRLTVLQYAALAIFLMACVNVSSLLVARYSSRKREFAVRAALGASRWRQIRQHLMESVALTSIGCVCGAAVAYGGVRFLLRLYQDQLPRTSEITVDGRLILFTIATALAGAAAFGLTTAFHERSRDLETALRDGGRTGTSRRGALVRKSMVVVQVVCAMALLAGAGELIQSFRRLMQIDAGIDPTNLITMRVAIPESQYTTPAKVGRFFADAVSRIKSIPGVQDAASTNMLPVQSMGYNGDVEIPGMPPHAKSFYAEMRWISGDFLRTMGIPLLRGRWFLPEEMSGNRKAMVINQTMARRLWGARDPIGWKVRFDGPDLFTVVGVSRDVHQSGLARPALPELYVPLPTQTNALPVQSIAVRSQMPMDQLVPRIRRELRAIEPQAAVYFVKSMEDVLTTSVSGLKTMMALSAVLGALALLLAAFGLHGVMSYLVNERRQEFAIRLAVGARPWALFRMVLRQSFAIVNVGLALGIAAALLVTRLLPALLFGIGEIEPLTFALALAVLAATAVLAVATPALRALNVDAIDALRQE